MIRYSSIEEVTAALLELERHVSTEKNSSEKHSGTENLGNRTSTNVPSANGENLANGDDENGRLHEEVVDNITDSGRDTNDHEGYDDEFDEETHDDGDTDDEDYDHRGAPGSDEDDEVRITQKVAQVDPEEAASFEQELRAVMQESMEQRSRPALNMVIPMNLFEGSTKDHHGRGTGGESGDETLGEEAGGGKEVKVKVLVKRGNKQQTKQMYIPSDSSLVQSTKQKEAAELEEKQDIKRRVLD